MVWDGVGGNRLDWAGVPRAVRAAIEAAMGSAVVEAVSQRGGFSPGLAARLRLADGRRVFAKAVGAERNPQSVRMHRREAEIAGGLPAGVAVPRLLWSGAADWAVLVFEDVAGHTPPLPWRPKDWHRVHDALVALARDLTSSPVDAGPIGQDPDAFRGWRSLAADPALAAALDPWSRRNVDRLAALEAGWAAAAAGDTLLHGDLRADNILLTDDRVLFVDWPQAAVGAAWVDLVCMLPSVALQGGPDPDDVWRTSPVAAGADPAAVDAVLAAVTGFFVHSALLPSPPGLPTLRRFQHLQAGPALAWLRSRLR
ncbi:MAG: phosphotransferase [Actinophytocola sp.]|uniref:phosphotransferase family protein n=1 Tax=Actinophytocola sp. TaxID=1872138 RepID=UPI0013222106|nr:phosphotransferase [Actinophytocola sp.]MPZ83390.1 phosphotransferase [Actinophytocola sp.]